MAVTNAKLKSFAQAYTPITDIQTLYGYLQDAVTLEFATIPAYITAMYSMRDKTCQAYQLTTGVAMEEMFHAYQAANLLVAIGGIPRFTNSIANGDHVPTYPTFIPHGDTSKTPYIQLRRASKALYQDVFMAIETPAPALAPAQDENIATIGQFYKAIELGLIALEEQAQANGNTIFQNTAGYAQHLDYYIGSDGGRIIEVTDIDSAKQAIQQIMEQGEGAIEPGKPLVATEAWGAYNHYGNRLDGHYGPIVGTPNELSHYFKFKMIADGKVPLPDTYPIVAVPDVDNYRNPEALSLAQAFNIAYTSLLHSLEESFLAGATGRAAYFERAMKLMHQTLPTLSNQLMQTCIWAEGDSDVGPNAAPTWEWDESDPAKACDLLRPIMQTMQQKDSSSPELTALQTAYDTLQDIQCR